LLPVFVLLIMKSFEFITAVEFAKLIPFVFTFLIIFNSILYALYLFKLQNFKTIVKNLFKFKSQNKEGV